MKPPRKTLFYISACITASILAVLVLHVVSDRINHDPNGFIRLFPPHLTTPQKIKDIRYNSYYIAGMTGKNIYLGNNTDPTHLLKTDLLLKDTQHIRLKVSENIKLIPGLAKVQINGSRIFMTEGSSPLILKGKLKDHTLRMVDSTSFFLASQPLSADVLALRTYNGKQAVLARKNLVSSEVHLVPGILEKQVDGIFCTDGQLHYNPETAALVYVYFYRNRFIRMDTTLNVSYRGNTIDTVSRARITLTRPKEDGSYTLSAPPLTVNKRSCIDRSNIYILSDRMADNENEKTFRQCSVIDVYKLEDGTYRSSFYLPDYRGEKVRHFRVFNGTLFALYDHYLYTYRLNF